jgi:hypothetical protein
LTPANLSGFTLVNPDKRPVERPVFATEVAIWNSGDLSLSQNSDRVRDPLQITLNGVIYYNLISRVNLVPADNYDITISQDRRSISIKWKFFDPNQGVRLTLVHSSDGDPRITFTGRFFEAELREESHSALRKKEALPPGVPYIGFGAILLGVLAFVSVRKLRAEFATGRFNRSSVAGRVLGRLLRSEGILLLPVILVVEGIFVVGFYAYVTYFTIAPPV